MPVEKSEGSQGYGATLNSTGAFQFRATRVGSDSLLSQIITLVQEAQGSKAPIQRLADVVSSYFVPAVLGLAAASFLFLASVGAETSRDIRFAGHGGGAHYRVPLCAGSGYSHGHYGGHRERR